MKRLLIPIVLLASLLLSGSASAHGGVYVGPGDVVPPGAGSPPSSTTPITPTTPGTPNPPPTAATPGDPTTPANPVLPIPPTLVKTATTSRGVAGPDLNRWEFWWEFNKGPFLNLKAKVQSGAVSTGESDILVGIVSGARVVHSFAPTPASIRNTIIPQLRNLIARADDREITGGGMMALAKIQLDPSVTDIFQANLDSADQEIAETAALALGVLQAPQAYPMLISLADDTLQGRKLTGKANGVPARTRAFAIYGLGLLGARTEDAILQAKIADKLWIILTRDQSSFKDLRTASVISMGVIPYQDPSVPVARLLQFLDDANHDTLVRAHCPNAIAKILNNVARNEQSQTLTLQSVASFSKYCKSKYSKNEIVQSCVYSLGMLVNSSAEFPIEVAFNTISFVDKNTKNKQAQRYATIAMAYLGSRVSGDSPYFEKSINFLLTGLRRGKGGLDAWSGLALGVMGFKVMDDGRSMPSVVERGLLKGFNDEGNPQRRGAYAVALGLMRSELAKESLWASIQESRDESFQGFACLSLGMIGAREYKDDLIKLVLGSVRKPDLLKQASIALGLMKDKGVAKVLINLIRPVEGRKPSLAVLSSAAIALGFIGDKSTVAPLLETMNDSRLTGLARAFSAIALGAVAEKYLLPWNSIYSVDLNYRASVQTLTIQNSGVLDIH